MPRYGFDERNSGLYVLICWLCMAVSTFLAIISMSSNRLDWMNDGLIPTLSFAMVAALCLAIITLMPKLAYFRTAGIGAVFLTFGLAYLISGGAERLAWLFIAIGCLSILIPVALGKRSDEQSSERTLRIRLPWT